MTGSSPNVEASLPSDPAGRIRRSTLRRLILANTLASLAVGQGQAAASESSSVQLEEIVVTAQRRAERLEDVPMSVSLLSSDVMEKSVAVDLRDLSQVTPGLLISQGGFNTQPSIRGVTTVLGGNFYENNVAVYVDGLYQQNPVSINNDFANIESVQVLKGPQGALYGRNATGGAILINTLAPSKTFTGSVGVGYADFNETTFSGYLSGPITDRIRFSVAGYWRESDGWFEFSDPTTGAPTGRDASPIKKENIRVKLEADVTENLTATLGYNYNKLSDATVLHYLSFQNMPPTYPAPPLRSPTPLKTKSPQFAPLNEGIIDEFSLKLVWETGIGTITSTSGYTEEEQVTYFDFDGTYVDLSRLQTSFPREVYQSDLNFNITAFDKFDLLIGGNYFESTQPTDYFRVWGNGAVSAVIDQGVEQEAYSFYLDGTYSVTDRLSLTVGGAYAREKSSILYSMQLPSQIPLGTYLVPPIEKEATFEEFSPRASLRYELAPQTNVYFSYSQGFKAGLWQIGIPPVIPAEPETVTAYEIGFKMVRPNIRFDAAAFLYDYKDIQTSVTIPDPNCTTPPNCNFQVLVFNGPSADIYGVEAQLAVTPIDRLNIRLGAAYLDAEFNEFTNSTGTGFDPATGLNVGNQPQDWSNQQLARAPEFSGNIGFDYTLPIFYGDVELSANAPFTSSYVVNNLSLYGPLAGDLAGKQRYRQGGYTLLNAAITWTDPAGKLSLSVFGRNLTDKRYWLVYSSNGNFGDYGIHAEPRVIGGRIKYRF